MKNYIIAILLVTLLVLASIIYKIETSSVHRFYFSGEIGNAEIEVPLFLYVFLSKRNCRDCLEFTEVLNSLPSHFIVYGIVPEDELKDEAELRSITGAVFPLLSASKFKKYIPKYSPSIIGVSPNGDIMFTLPGVPGEKEYLQKFLDSLYGKLYPLFLNEKFSK